MEIISILLIIMVITTIHCLVLKNNHPNKRKNFFYEDKKWFKFLEEPLKYLLFFSGMLFIFSITNDPIFYPLPFLGFILLVSFNLFFLSPKMLLIETDKIRCLLHWTINFNDLKEWHLDLDKKMVIFIDNHNKEYYFNIKADDNEKIQEALNHISATFKTIE